MMIYGYSWYKWQQRTGRLTDQVGWLGLRVGGHLALSLHWMNRINSCNRLPLVTAL